MKLEERDDHPHKLADAVYEAVCKETEEKPTAKGAQAFRDKVFENCTPRQIVLTNARLAYLTALCVCSPRLCTADLVLKPATR